MEIIDKLKRHLDACGQTDHAALWSQDSPHFGGAGAHRYQAKASEYISDAGKEDCKVCIYCLRPENYKEGK